MRIAGSLLGDTRQFVHMAALVALLAAAAPASAADPAPASDQPSDPDSSIQVAPGLGIRRSGKRLVPRAHLDEDALAKTLAAHEQEVQACFERQRAADGNLAGGELVLSWGVNEVGRAGAAVVSKGSTLQSEPVARCVGALIPTWAFPHPTGRGVAFVVHTWAFPSGASGPVGSGDREVGLNVASVAGSIDAAAVGETIRAHADEVRECYELALAGDPALEGTVVLKWLIQQDGSVTDMTVASGTTFTDQPTQECIMSRLATWRFPKPGATRLAVVTYPWVLKAAGAAAHDDDVK